MKTLNVLKAFVLVMAMSLAAVNVHAQQKGDMAVGGHIDILTGSNSTNIGIGATFRYNVLDPLRLEGGLTIYPKSSNVSYWDFSANGHWLFPINDKFILYPIGGLGIFGVSYSGSSVSRLALNIGGGAEYLFTDNLSGNFELKYKIASDWDCALFTFGVHYKF